MVIQINPNQLAVWRTPRALQIGIGSRPPIFENISNPQEQVIAALYRGVSQSQLEVICERVGLTSESLERLLKKLEPVLIDDSRFPDHPPDFVATEPDTADARRASLRNSASAEAVMRRRGMASVHLDSLGNSNFWLVFGLARAGIGKVICHDKAKVSILDSHKGGYPIESIGQPRIEAARERLQQAGLATEIIDGFSVNEATLNQISLGLLVAQFAVAPRNYARWLNRSVAHLAICFDASGAWVSPVVVPGVSPCLGCRDQHQLDVNPHWPAIATQLISKKQKFDDWTTWSVAAGLASGLILDYLDAAVRPSEATEATLGRPGYLIDSATLGISEQTWSRDEDCECALFSANNQFYLAGDASVTRSQLLKVS